MKVRDGHVSNSSSSSFVLLTSKENYEKAVADATPWQRAVAEAMKGEEGKFLGIDVVSFCGWSDAGGGSSFEYLREEIKYEGDDEESAYDGWDAFEKLLKRNKDAIFEGGSDW